LIVRWTERQAETWTKIEIETFDCEMARERQTEMWTTIEIETFDCEMERETGPDLGMGERGSCPGPPQKGGPPQMNGPVQRQTPTRDPPDKRASTSWMWAHLSYGFHEWGLLEWGPIE
jgi:hypothetical protein